MQFDRKTAYLLLKLHLTLANLFILFVLCPSKFGWLLTYSWQGGETMCKVTFVECYVLRYLYTIMFCIQVISYVFMAGVNMPCYVITCIAIDRCRVVHKMCSAQNVSELLF